MEVSSPSWEQGLSLVRLNLQSPSFQAATEVSLGFASPVPRRVCPCSCSSLSSACKLWLKGEWYAYWGFSSGREFPFLSLHTMYATKDFNWCKSLGSRAFTGVGITLKI